MADPGHAAGNRSWTVHIPAPAGWLNANSRTDRRRQTSDRRAWRDAGCIYARKARLPKLAKAHIVAELRFADKRVRRDPHNYYPTLKALIDGLIDYGLLPDDSHQYLIGPDLRLGEPLPARRFGSGGEVVLTIQEMS